ncbi:valine--tRNA ligase [soil metagenome]
MKLPKVYQPAIYESDIYDLWERSGAFVANPSSKKERFSISMPPPNETGTLSLGHSLFLTLQDIMVRHARQQGKDALWLPGTDHAALAVNAIIEKKLAEEGTNKHEIGREAFLDKTRDFVGESRETMLSQMRAMGASADWSRLRYTLDESLNRCVNETFISMHKAGLIYRGNRIVNWDPNLETNVSDDEMEHIDETTNFYTFKYGPFEIGTSRPETKFGDKYVVVHPDDKRYTEYKHGDTFETEWINGPITATIIKDEVIDMSFGTGAMTITPWHDHTDFEIAERHDLDKEQIIDLHGKLLPVAEEFAGMGIDEAREKIVKKLRKKGLVVKEDKNYEHTVAINERGQGKIEPQIRLQWFVDVNKEAVQWKGKTLSLKQVMRSVIDESDITITPSRFEKTYFNWIDNLRDWCISRQIWWGHRIPAWYRITDDGEQIHVGTTPPSDDKEGWHEWQQDPDTLDTWFSSSLWTWSTLIDKDAAQDESLSFEELLKKSPDFQAYHPTNIMETGCDIIFFWVARMILSTTFMTKQVPFKQIYLHGMVRTEDGKKMSKSRPESVIDPMSIIPEYGTDALRLALIWGISPGNDQSWNYGKIQATRNFCNKLWNIARYTEGKLGDDFVFTGKVKPESIADHWMLNKLQHSIDDIDKKLGDFQFSEAFDQVYHLVWDDFADWYIEATKTELNEQVLAYCLESILKLLHPFAPFVTETIWQTLKWEDDSLLITSPWPKVIKPDASQVKTFEDVKVIVSEIRYIKSALRVRNDLHLYHKNDELLTEQGTFVEKMARLGGVKSVEDGHGLQLTSTSHDCWLDIDQATAKRYVDELHESIKNATGTIENLEKRLANKNYVAQAPKKLVKESRKQLEDAKTKRQALERELERFRQDEEQ